MINLPTTEQIQQALDQIGLYPVEPSILSVYGTLLERFYRQGCNRNAFLYQMQNSGCERPLAVILWDVRRREELRSLYPDIKREYRSEFCHHCGKLRVRRKDEADEIHCYVLSCSSRGSDNSPPRLILSEEQIEAFKSGKTTISGLAREVGFSTSTVRTALKRQGIPLSDGPRRLSLSSEAPQ